MNSKGRLCGDRNETVDNVICKPGKLAQNGYKNGYDRVEKENHWERCKKLKFYHMNKPSLLEIKAHSTGAVEYTDFTSRDGSDTPKSVSWIWDLKSDGEAPVMLELWGMWSTPSLLSLPGLLRPGVVASDRVLFMGQIELFDI